ncbi:MAG: HEAT repeat domain-containing protein [Chlamydiia bacterium]|nr:HEAT repeat domain-containing protein [Chlamydiia bacterium]
MDSVVDAIDMEILMHRDAHFSGSFDVMLEYYKQSGVGTMPDFEIEEIQRLQTMESELGQNLSEIYLPDAAKDAVIASKALYQEFRRVYSDEKVKKENLLISDLILSEEEHPEKEIRALIQEGKKMVPLLIHLISSDLFYDPLFPGYGRSPIFAAQCLGKIQDERAIPPLFEALGQENFFTDEEIIYALASFGDRSKSFLLKRLKQDPLSKDNEYAAIALSGFTEDKEIATAALEVLEKKETLKRPLFASYLIFACSDLTKASMQERFINLSKQKKLPESIRHEMMTVIKNWKKTT